MVHTCRVVLEDDVGGTHRVAKRNMDGTTVVRHAALDAATSYATRQRQVAAVMCPDHVALTAMHAQVAVELMSIQVDGHGLALNVQVIAELNIGIKSNLLGRPFDGGVQVILRIDDDDVLRPNTLCNHAQQGKHQDKSLFHKGRKNEKF